MLAFSSPPAIFQGFIDEMIQADSQDAMGPILRCNGANIDAHLKDANTGRAVQNPEVIQLAKHRITHLKQATRNRKPHFLWEQNA
jgi:hypothetical protein